VLTGRLRIATAMAFRDQLRRPLVLILMIVVPAYVVIRSVAQTKPTPRLIELPSGLWVMTTMKAIHGPEMAKISVAFVAALVGVFVMQSALQGDRRLVVAGLRAGEAVLARMVVVVAVTAVAVAVASVVTGLKVTIVSWPPVVAALILIGLIYAGIGALVGALLDKLAATYLILFLAMTDLGVVQTPMFHASPSRLAPLLPGYGPTRVMFDGADASQFHATGELLIALAWAAGLAAAVYLVLRRALTARA
jgi:hypothetical protein